MQATLESTLMKKLFFFFQCSTLAVMPKPRHACEKVQCQWVKRSQIQAHILKSIRVVRDMWMIRKCQSFKCGKIDVDPPELYIPVCLPSMAKESALWIVEDSPCVILIYLQHRPYLFSPTMVSHSVMVILNPVSVPIPTTIRIPLNSAESSILTSLKSNKAFQQDAVHILCAVQFRGQFNQFMRYSM